MWLHVNIRLYHSLSSVQRHAEPKLTCCQRALQVQILVQMSCEKCRPFFFSGFSVLILGESLCVTFTSIIASWSVALSRKNNTKQNWKTERCHGRSINWQFFYFTTPTPLVQSRIIPGKRDRSGEYVVTKYLVEGCRAKEVIHMYWISSNILLECCFEIDIFISLWDT